MFKYLVLVVALLLAGVAGFYSVFGLSHLFAGAYWAVVIMAGTIEVSKLVSASLLKRYWKNLSWFIRLYLIAGTFGIMVLTSAGIYGFLTNAYQQTLNKKSVSDVGVKNAEFRKQAFQKQVDNETKAIETAENRIDKLTEIRSGQEVRLDSLYARRYYTTAKRTEKAIQDANDEIAKLNESMTQSTEKIKSLNDSIATYEIKIVELKTNEVSAELGPLMYIAELTGRDMGEIINYFVLLIIIVFDPMAIILLISFNILRDIKEEQVESENEILEQDEELYEAEDEVHENIEGSNEPENTQENNQEDLDEIPQEEIQELINDNWFDLIEEPKDDIDKAIDELESEPVKMSFVSEPPKEIEYISNEDKFNKILEKAKNSKSSYGGGFVKS